MRRGDGLYLRGSTWRLDFYHEGKRHIVTLGRNISKTVAREIASVKRGAILKGEAGIGKKPKDIALKKAVELYLAWVGANRRANTLRFHKECLGALEKHFGTKRLGDISESQVEAYKQGRVKNGRGMVAANRQLASLSALYNWCREQKPPIYDGTNPVEGVERYEESEGRIRFLEWDEEAKLLEAAGEPLRTIALCGTDAGLRIKAEALTFRWSALDFRRGILTVESAYAKNGNTRAIPMTDRLKEALVQHRFRAGKQDPEAHVFVSRSKEPFRSIRNIFRAACEAAGLGEDVTPHTLRHTFGSRLAMNGVDVRTIQELMGHRRIEMTIRYTHVSDEHKSTALRAALVPPAAIPANHSTPRFTPAPEDVASVSA